MKSKHEQEILKALDKAMYDVNVPDELRKKLKNQFLLHLQPKTKKEDVKKEFAKP